MAIASAPAASARGLDAGILKLIALAAMTVDHAGLILLGNLEICRIIGRLAFPIFAFMIAEGCQYTHNKKRYLGQVFLLGLVCQAVYFAVSRSLYQCVLITFSLSILMIFALQRAQRTGSWIAAAALAAAIWVLCEWAPGLLAGWDFAVDYGFWGVMLPVLVWMCPGRWGHLSALAAGMLLLCLSMDWPVQWFCFLALVPLYFYNGQRGARWLKYGFYLYYPLHLAVLEGIRLLMP